MNTPEGATIEVKWTKISKDVQVAKIVNGQNSLWMLKSDIGGIHVWREKFSDAGAGFLGATEHGGVEFHRPKPHTFNADTESECWLLGGPCEHHGSTVLYDEIFRGHTECNDKVFGKMLALFIATIEEGKMG